MVAVLCVVDRGCHARAAVPPGEQQLAGTAIRLDAHLREAYRVVLPPLVIWFASAIVAALASSRMGLFAAAAMLSFVMIPWMHHRLKAYQHARACYGARAFEFLPATPAFYAVYFKALLLTLAGSLVGGVLVMFGLFASRDAASDAAAADADARRRRRSRPRRLPGRVAVFRRTLQATVWSHTRVGDVRFSTAIAAGPLFRLTLKNVLLTLAGLQACTGRSPPSRWRAIGSNACVWNPTSRSRRSPN